MCGGGNMHFITYCFIITFVSFWTSGVITFSNQSDFVKERFSIASVTSENNTLESEVGLSSKEFVNFEISKGVLESEIRLSSKGRKSETKNISTEYTKNASTEDTESATTEDNEPYLNNGKPPLKTLIDKLWKALQSDSFSDNDLVDSKKEKKENIVLPSEQQKKKRQQVGEADPTEKVDPQKIADPTEKVDPQKIVDPTEKVDPQKIVDPTEKTNPQKIADPTDNKANSNENDQQMAKKSAKENKNSCTVELKIEGTIGPATLDILEQAISKVKKENCLSLLLLINTPGGQLLSTRKIVDRILNTDFPILCLIYPAGAHAGSAGAIIMQACHVNGGIDTTNIGAATPIAGGKDLSKDLRKKMINDTTSWLDSLTELRKRNKKFGRDIITEAKAVSSTEAAKENAIDFVGKTKEEFLKFAEGRTTTVQDGELKTVKVGQLIPLDPGFRYRLTSFITEPEFVYILFVGSLMLIYFEITNPGLGAPGILGAMGLIISFMGMHKLNFSWGGLILIFLSIALFLVEVFISGFGIFGAMGIVSFVIGSVLLFDPTKTGGVDISMSLILSVTALFALLISIVTWFAWSTFRMRKKASISDDFMDPDSAPGEVVYVKENGISGTLVVGGENWKFKSDKAVSKGDQVKVLSYKHFTLKVTPLEKASNVIENNSK